MCTAYGSFSISPKLDFISFPSQGTSSATIKLLSTAIAVAVTYTVSPSDHYFPSTAESTAAGTLPTVTL